MSAGSRAVPPYTLNLNTKQICHHTDTMGDKLDKNFKIIWDSQTNPPYIMLGDTVQGSQTVAAIKLSISTT